MSTFYSFSFSSSPYLNFVTYRHSKISNIPFSSNSYQASSFLHLSSIHSLYPVLSFICVSCTFLDIACNYTYLYSFISSISVPFISTLSFLLFLFLLNLIILTVFPIFNSTFFLILSTPSASTSLPAFPFLPPLSRLYH